VCAEYPAVNDEWYRYENPIEKKWAYKHTRFPPAIQRVYDRLHSYEFVTTLRELSGIPDLEVDPHMHGAGLHAYGRGDKLDLHLDYSVHPISGKERRLNLILYLTPDWKPEYGGELELWHSDLSSCGARLPPTFNTAVLFRTSDISYHGIPHPIQCPQGMFRRLLTVFYVSPSRPGIQERRKASFIPLPGTTPSEGLLKLYEIRKTRLLTADDVSSALPNL
jgi:Rps23 Pro-64 3,4-dihydroxylase Tpa1-like proline 4-hydroxylase